MSEGNYQRDLIHKLNRRFPGCLILKNDPSYRQGIPDLVMLYDDLWAAFEVKKAPEAAIRPNQKHYVDLMNHMSFAAFIDPENEEDVLDALQSTFAARRATRNSKRK